MKVLVTGSEGFIGSELCRQLLEAGFDEVIGMDNYSKYGFVPRSHQSNRRFKFIRIDLCEDVSYSQLKNKIAEINPEYVIHCAALIGGIEYFHKYPYDIISKNSLMDKNVIDAVIFAKNQQGSKFKRFVALSSSMVFENHMNPPSKEDDIDSVAPPSSTYGFSKLALEYMCKGAFQQHGLEYSIVRPFNASGIGEEDFIQGKNSHVIPDLIVKSLRTKDSLQILGDGNQIRCYTSVKDIARGIITVMESKLATNETFNISNPKATTVIELAEMIWKKINPNKTFQWVSAPAFKYDVQKRIPDVSKAEKVLGFKADISLDETLDEVIAYIKSRLTIV